MAEECTSRRPTRWQKARADTQFLRWKREAVFGIAAAPVAFVLLRIAGSKAGAMDELIVVGASVIAVLILLPLSELAWNWLQAPMHLLTEDVTRVERRVAQLPEQLVQPVAQTRPQPSLRTVVLDQIRGGRELLATGDQRRAMVPQNAAVLWTSQVSAALIARGADEVAQRFLEATDLSGHAALRARLHELEIIAEELQE